MLYATESETLKNSRWPKCDQLAEQLAAHGPSASDALEQASKSKIHHVRSAALRGLHTVNPERAKKLAEALLTDRSYEVRETAARILGVPTPG